MPGLSSCRRQCPAACRGLAGQMQPASVLADLAAHQLLAAREHGNVNSCPATASHRRNGTPAFHSWACRRSWQGGMQQAATMSWLTWLQRPTCPWTSCWPRMALHQLLGLQLQTSRQSASSLLLLLLCAALTRMSLCLASLPTKVRQPADAPGSGSSIRSCCRQPEPEQHPDLKSSWRSINASSRLCSAWVPGTASLCVQQVSSSSLLCIQDRVWDSRCSLLEMLVWGSWPLSSQNCCSGNSQLCSHVAVSQCRGLTPLGPP